MSFEIDIGLTLLTGHKDVNEDFAVAIRAEPGRAAAGAMVAMADGVSTGLFRHTRDLGHHGGALQPI